MALRRVWMYSPNFTSGNNGRRLLVIHSSEGAQTYQSLGNFFAQSSSQVSSHTGIDNEVRGTIGEYVKRGNSAWTASGANMVSVQAELCTPSGASNNWSRNTWLSKDTMLQNLADWLREESQATGIPLNLLNNSQAQGSGRGVCEHKNLGAWGGGHVDCGPNFPIDHVMDLAHGSSTPPPPTGTTGRLVQMSNIVLDNGVDAKTPMAFPPGATKIRMYSNASATVDIDWVGGGTNNTMTPSYDNAPTWDIPGGARGAVFRRRDAGTNTVSVAVG